MLQYAMAFVDKTNERNILKKLTILFLSVLSISIFLTGCKKNSSITGGSTTLQGSYLISTPSGAQVWIDGVNSGDVTPHLMDSLSVGIHTVTLKFTDYDDISFVDSVKLSTVDTVSKTMNSSVANLFGPATLYLYPGTQANGVDLATGNTHALNAGNASLIDVYYSSEADTAMNYIFASQKNSLLTRTTYLYPSLETQLFNGHDGTVYSATDVNWVTSFPLYGASVFYVYGNDKHYSKVLLTGQGTGFIEIKWLYNKTADNLQF
jgi:hypothetical protein